MAAALIPIIASVASGAVGGLLNRGSKQSQGPNYTPAQQSLLSQLLQGFGSNILNATSGGLLQAILRGGLSLIGQKNNNAMNLVNNMLTSRGLGRTTGGASMLFNPIFQGMTDKANLLMRAPQIQQDLSSQALAQAGNFFNSMRTGNEQQQSGNILGGIAGGANLALSNYLGKMWDKTQKDPRIPVPTLPTNYGSSDDYGNTNYYDPYGDRG